MAKLLKTDRREFLKQGIALGLVAGTSVFLGKTVNIWAKEATRNTPDLVAVKNGEPEAMFKKAISLMGGMEQFVKKGQSVVVKPNIGFPSKPQLGATTNPLLVKSIIEHCLAAGAKKVYVFDHVVSLNAGLADKCYKLSGIEDIAKNAGAIVVPADNAKYYKDVKIPGGKKLSYAKVHELVLNSEALINVPVLKHHSFSHLSIAMKNLMGIVWDRLAYHESGLDQCIADFCLFCKPTLNVVDAYRVIMRNGPYAPGNASLAARDIDLKKTLLISRDIVAVDTAAAKIFGMGPEDIAYIGMGHQHKIGNMNLDELKVVTHSM